jgi:hypothetical protein
VKNVIVFAKEAIIRKQKYQTKICHSTVSLEREPTMKETLEASSRWGGSSDPTLLGTSM